MNQADIAAPLTKASWVCQKVEDVGTDLAKAIRIAKSGRPGPVHLSLPTDALESAFPSNAITPKAESFEAEGSAIEGNDIHQILSQLKGAAKPLILTGPMMQSKKGRVILKSLETALGMPVVGMESPRGIGDPSLGAFAEVLGQADCVLLLGKKSDFTLKFAQSPGIQKDCVFLQIDPDVEEIKRTKNAVGDRLLHSLQADTPTAIKALIAANQGSVAVTSKWQEEVHAAIDFRPNAWKELAPRTGNIHPVQALAPLQAILDSHPDSVLISDGGEIGQWAQACLKAPNRVLNGVAGSIGAGLPFATAARVAKPDSPIVAVVGDGTFGFHCAEIDTAVRYKLPFILIVGNDARWNAEYQIQVRDYGQDRTIGCELLPSNYERVCEAFGGHGELVNDSNEVLPAAKRAHSSNLPACINILIEGLAAPNIKRP
jgi:acetolactate synthase-1/2/3 large subunit